MWRHHQQQAAQEKLQSMLFSFQQFSCVQRFERGLEIQPDGTLPRTRRNFTDYYLYKYDVCLRV